MRIFDVDEGLTMIIGPSRTATMLEIGVVQSDTADVVVHAMRARERFLEQ